MKRLFLSVALVVMAVPALAAAQEDPYPEVYASRPLVLNRNMVEAGLDVGMGLNKGRMAKDLTLDVSATWGAFRNFDLGVVVNALNYAASASGTHFGGFDLVGRYRFIDMLAAELHVYAPGDHTYLDKFGDQRVGVMLGIPFQWVALRDILKVHAALAFDVGFVADSYVTSGGESPQMRLGLTYGLTWNMVRFLFADLTFGTDLCLRPSAGSFGDRVSIPATLSLGGTVARGRLDLFASFALADLKPATGSLVDRKTVGIGARMRF